MSRQCKNVWSLRLRRLWKCVQTKKSLDRVKMYGYQDWDSPNSYRNEFRLRQRIKSIERVKLHEGQDWVCLDRVKMCPG